MNFEQAVVNDVLHIVPASKPYFYNGTLFVADVDNTEANTVLESLRTKYDGTLIMSDCAFEYAYDFC